MTRTSNFWDGVVIGDAGPYSSEQFATFAKYAFGLGAPKANVGPMLGNGTSPYNSLRVEAQSPAAAAVNVLPGSAFVAGRLVVYDTTTALTIAANSSGNPRIDVVVLRADYSLQTIVLAVLQGTPAVSPAPPNLTQTIGTLYEIPLADIAVANAFTSISNSNITPRHEWANAASGIWLDGILNNSGGTLQTGSVTIWDTTADRAITTTTARDNKKTAGVWVGRTSNGGYGRLLVRGVGYVLATTAVTRGDLLVTSTTAGQAVVAGTTGALNAIIGRALETTSGAGLVLTYIDAHIVNDLDWVIVQDQRSSGSANGGALTATTWTTRTLNTEVVDTGSLCTLAANQATLQPGTYTAVFISAFGLAVVNRTRLRDTTGGATLAQSVNGTGIGTSVGVGEFTLTVASAVELQYYVSGTGGGTSPGLGSSLSSGEVEVYASVIFIRHAETA